MTPAAVLAQLRRVFSYSADGRFDHWRMLRPTLAGRLEGDCEDFALTLAFRLAEQSWLRFWWHQITVRTVLWHCTTSSGVGHVVLWHRGAGWADNIADTWQTRTPHRRWFPYLLPMFVLKVCAGVVFSKCCTIYYALHK